MKVLHIAAGNLFGGIERMLVTLACQGSRSHDMESAFALSFEGILSRMLLAAGTPVRVLGDVRTRAPWTIIRARRNLRVLLAGEHYDAVVCHSAWCQAIFAPVVQEARIPQVFWLHDIPTRFHWLDLWAGRCAPDLAVCNSRFTSSYLHRMFPRTKSEVIYCPVPGQRADASILGKLREELAPLAGTVTIIQASRMQPGKGHRLLLNALSRLTTMPDWSCWIVGGPQRAAEAKYFESLHQQARAMGLSARVKFLGQRQDAQALMQLADIHCQPNEKPESFGIAFIEALSSGLPVVTTRIGGAVEIVDHTCGRLVAPGNVQELSDALATLIRDSSLRLELGRAGPGRARALCSPDAQLGRLRDVLARLALT